MVGYFQNIHSDSVADQLLFFYFVRQIYILDPPYFTHYLVVLNNNKILLSINLETSRSAPEDESPSAVSMLFERI